MPFVSGPHQGGAPVGGLQVNFGRVLQQDEQDGGVTSIRSLHERGEAEAAWQVDARALLQQLPHHLQLIPTRGGMQHGFGCGPTVISCSRAERVDQPSLAHPLDHLLQLTSLRRAVDLDGKRDGRAQRGLASVRWGSRRGGGSRLMRRCVLPDEHRGGHVALDLGMLQGSDAVVADQLGVGPGMQQRLHARLFPSVSGRDQGGEAIADLQVKVRRVLQEDEHN